MMRLMTNNLWISLERLKEYQTRSDQLCTRSKTGVQRRPAVPISRQTAATVAEKRGGLSVGG